MPLRMNIEKVTALPQTLTANTLYFVLNGDGFDMFLTNSAGTEALPHNAPPLEAGVDQFLLMGVGFNG